MRITYRGDYALKAVLDLSLHYPHGLTTIHELAKRIDAPVKFLEQILLDLKKGGFIESRRGKVGGFLLSRSPDKITVGEVARFIDGPIEPIACVREGYTDCADIYKCVFRKIWQNVDEATAHIIDKITFAELAAQASATHHALVYSI